MGLNSALYTAITGLNAATYGINTSSNNIANANVKGYSRRSISFSSAGYIDTGVGYIGSGVKVDGVTRVKDVFLDGQIRDEVAKLNSANTQKASLDYVESFLNEPSDSALSSQMSNMLNEFSKLANDPSSGTLKESTLQKVQMFTTSVNYTAKGYKTTLADNNQIEANYVTRAEEIITDLQELNNSIATITSNGSTPNELMDRRDVLIDELSQYAHLEVTINDDESFTISAKTTGADQPLVGGTPVAFNTIKDDLTEGKVKGIQDANTKIQGYLDDFDSFVETLATDMNTIQGNNGGGVMFTFTAGDAAETLTVHSDLIDGTRPINVGNPANPSDGSNAFLFADLRAGNMSNGKNAQDQYNELLVNVGTDISNLDSDITTREAVLNQLEQRKESISGVSIDEETVDLMTFQQAYEANARVMNVVQEMMDTLLGIFR